jgi:hypothetical protein
MRRVALVLAIASVVCGSTAASTTVKRPPETSNAARNSRAFVEVVGVPSSALTARIVNLKPALKPGEPPTPAITSGSGIARIGSWIFVAQDDSTMLAARSDDGKLDSVRLFPSIDGADRFLDSLKNKNVKPDVECAVAVLVPARTAARFGAPPSAHHRSAWAVLAFGSGSKAKVRDRIALVFPAEPLSASHVVTVQADRFYERLRSEPALVGPGGELNIEGATIAGSGRFLRLYNRGNGTLGSVNGSVDVPLTSLFAYLRSAAKDPAAPFTSAFANPKRYKLGTASDGAVMAITDAVTIGPLPGAPRRARGEIRILSAVVEHTPNAIDDGFTSDASLALELPDGQVLITPLTGVEDASSLKIEGLAVIKAEWKGSPARLHVEIAGVADADATDPNTPSKIGILELTYQPNQ